MTGAGISASVEATGLIRRAQADGDFATVLRKGDPERGSLLLVVGSRGRHCAVLERTFDFESGEYRWTRAGPGPDESGEKLADFLGNRVRFDHDLWLIELDVAHPERFIAETTLSG